MTVTDINAAQLRQYYLQQLGITAWVPRVGRRDEDEAQQPQQHEEVMTPAAMTAVPQPPAPPMQAVPVTPEVVQPAQQSEVAAAVVAAVPRRRLFEADDAVVQPAAAVAAPATSTTATVAASAEDDVVAPFQLLFAVLDAELAVALQLPALVQSGLREQEQRLLQNLLRWLGYPLPAQQSLLQYRWPLPGASGREMATRTLTLFLQQAASTRAFRHLLVLGPAPAACLQDAAITEWRSWPTHGLTEMLALPQLKRDVWLQLQPLQRLLQQHAG
jgi:hypothetical protein